MDNTNESDKSEGHISPSLDSIVQSFLIFLYPWQIYLLDCDRDLLINKGTDTPSSAKEHEGPSKIATASKNGSQGTSKKP